mgnify:FL=1
MQNNNKKFELMKHIPNAHKAIEARAERSKDFCKFMGEQKKAQYNIKYGQNDRNVMDVFNPASLVRATLIFLHEGYWIGSDKSQWSHLALGAVLSDVRVVIPNYSLCPDASLPDIALEIKQCVEFVANKYSEPIIIAGQQAGGHLAARMASKGMLEPGVAARISHIMPISPLSDLRPLIDTTMNNTLGLSEDTATQESTACLEVDEDITVTVWVGSDEQPIYLQQAELLAARWDCFFVKSKHRNYLDILDGLESETSKLLARLFVNLDPKE